MGWTAALGYSQMHHIQKRKLIKPEPRDLLFVLRLWKEQVFKCPGASLTFAR